MTGYRDSLIGRKYQSLWEFAHVIATIPAGTTISLTYTPPSNKATFFIRQVSGTNILAWGKFSQISDGEYIGKNLYTSKIWEQIREQELTIPIRNNIKTVITNLDNVSHVADFAYFGFVIPLSLVDAFTDEITNCDLRKQNCEIISLLKSIDKKLEMR